MLQYNPYGLVDMVINKKHIHGRPFRFDSEIVDFNTFKNAQGDYVRPSMLSTVCPDCGAGLEVPVSLPDPPFGTVIAECEHCSAKTPLVDPFANPLVSGRVNELELDPLLYDHNKPLADDGLSVADRLGAVDGGEEESALIAPYEKPDETVPAASGEPPVVEDDSEASEEEECEEEAPESPEEGVEDDLEDPVEDDEVVDDGESEAEEEVEEESDTIDDPEDDSDESDE